MFHSILNPWNIKNKCDTRTMIKHKQQQTVCSNRGIIGGVVRQKPEAAYRLSLPQWCDEVIYELIMCTSGIYYSIKVNIRRPIDPDIIVEAI